MSEANAQRIAGPSAGSRTITAQDNAAQDNQPEQPPPVGVLQLRGASGSGAGRRVVWTEETVDNEGMGKKKSKICCIYHKPKAFDESSDESSSGASSSEDESSDDDASSVSSASSASRSSGVNASKALREKKNAATARKAKAKGKRRTESGGEDGEECGEHCSHQRKPKPSKASKNRGGRTVTITEPVETHAEHSHDHGVGRPKPNAYEKGA